MLNRITLVGRLTRDPEPKYTTTGVCVANFAIAVDRPTKDAQGERETDFIDIAAFRNTAEFVNKYLTKGRLVAVDGRLQIRNWVAQDGTKRTKAEVVADNVQGLDKGSDAPHRAPEPRTTISVAQATAPAEYDPFEDAFADE